jgi:tRNA (adenine57-N1/adenine58-N1)-methyltransferase
VPIFLEETGKVKRLKANEKNEIHTDKGKFEYKEDEKIFKTNKGIFYFKSNYFVDKFRFIKRGPQTSHIKDLGLLFAKIMPQRDWTVLEAGSGSGQVSCFFANYVKEIYSFEKRKEFFEIAKKNIEELNLNNVKIFNKDLKEALDLEEIKNKKFDFIFIDLGEPWDFFELAREKLKLTGFLAFYIVSPRQLDKLINEWDRNYKNHFTLIDIFEVIERNWEVKGKEEKFTKPKTTGLMFTAFIVIFRKIEK